MGNSTKTLQNVIDYVSTRGDLRPVLPVGGFSTLMAREIGNDVLKDIIHKRFNWKWNRTNIAPFYTISWQQDYATVNLSPIGWLEHGFMIDINNTQTPKPIAWLEVVRDLERTSTQYGQPGKVCWQYNNQLAQDVWPGAQKTFTQPLGAAVTPSNPIINILDANGNILILTTFGITGNVAPAAAVNAAAGTAVADGTCVWTVANPNAQGFRVSPLPPQAGVVWQVNLVGQKAPPTFATMQQTLDPVPDDFAGYVTDGVIAYLYRQSPDPNLNRQFELKKAAWLQTMAEAVGAGDREKDDACFVPDRGIMDGSLTFPVGAANPYGPFNSR